MESNTLSSVLARIVKRMGNVGTLLSTVTPVDCHVIFAVQLRKQVWIASEIMLMPLDQLAGTFIPALLCRFLVFRGFQLEHSAENTCHVNGILWDFCEPPKMRGM